jgi:T-complex protein 1 subunit gamma
MMQEEDFTKILQMEEAYIKRICDKIIAHNPDLVLTERGFSDLAQHFLIKAGITAMRRLKKSDNLGVAGACGAAFVNRTEEITANDIVTGCGIFEVIKIGDKYLSFIEECHDPKTASSFSEVPSRIS